jgi:Flp pilus assembly protein TadB
MNRGYVMLLFNDTRGMIMIGIGLFMMLLGVMVMAKMVKFEI